VACRTVELVRRTNITARLFNVFLAPPETGKVIVFSLDKNIRLKASRNPEDIPKTFLKRLPPPMRLMTE
jgi:hypothetical protein